MSLINGKLQGKNSFEINLLEINPTIGEYQSVVRNIRKEVVFGQDIHIDSILTFLRQINLFNRI